MIGTGVNDDVSGLFTYVRITEMRFKTKSKQGLMLRFERNDVLTDNYSSNKNNLDTDPSDLFI